MMNDFVKKKLTQPSYFSELIIIMTNWKDLQYQKDIFLNWVTLTVN